jgi:hypothetical protein
VHRQHLASQEEIEAMSTLFREEIPSLSWFYATEYHKTNIKNKPAYAALPTATDPDQSEISQRYSVTLSSGKATTLHDYYEKADWNEKNAELPSYFQFIMNVMEDLITTGYFAIGAFGMSFVPLLQFFSGLGRRVWAHVIENYVIFIFTSVGIWTHLFASNYRLVDKYEEYSKLVDLYPEVKREAQRLNVFQADMKCTKQPQESGKQDNSNKLSSLGSNNDDQLPEERQIEMVDVSEPSNNIVSRSDGNVCVSNDDANAIDEMTPPKNTRGLEEDINWSQIHDSDDPMLPSRKLTPLMQTNAAINEIIFEDYLSAIVSSRVVLLQ